MKFIQFFFLITVITSTIIGTAFRLDLSTAEAAPVKLTVRDADFNPPPITSTGDPMPTLPLSNNIISVTMKNLGTEISYTVKVQKPFDVARNQYAIGLDVDANAETDIWVFLNDLTTHIAVVMDKNFHHLDSLPYTLSSKNNAFTVNVPTELSGLTPLAISYSFDLGVSATETMLFPIGEPIEMVLVSNFLDEALLETELTPLAMILLTGKACPPANGDGSWSFPKGGDANGDGVPDWLYAENVQEYRDAAGKLVLRIEEWCLDLGNPDPNPFTLDSNGFPNVDIADAFAKKVIHGDGTQGFITRCPYQRGDNSETKQDFDGDGIPDIIVHRVEDGGADDDRDGKDDAMTYLYDVNRKLHTATHYENDKATDSTTHSGPHQNFNNVEFHN